MIAAIPKDERLDNACLPCSIIVGAIFVLAKNQIPGYASKFKTISKLNSIGEIYKQRAINDLAQEYELLCKEYPELSPKFDHDLEETVEKLSKKFKLNILVHCSDFSPSVQFSYPPEFDESMGVVNLHMTEHNGTLHVAYIRNYSQQYFIDNGMKLCVICKRGNISARAIHTKCIR